MLYSHPGHWQLFLKRPDNIGLPLMEVKSKYLKEESFYYSQFNWNNPLGGGTPPTISTPPSTPTEQSIFLETFGNDGTTPNPNLLTNAVGTDFINPPLSWTTISLDSINGVYANNGDYTNNWSVIDAAGIVAYCGLPASNDPSEIPGASGGSALFMSDVSDTQAYITLPAINTLGKTNIKLQFKAVQLNPIAIYYSTNNISWTLINASYSISGTIQSGNNWGYDSINLPAGTANKATLYIKFQQLPGTGGNNWQLFDDIQVLATF